MQKTQFNNETKQTLNARNLHKELQSKQDFSTWIKNRLGDFVENIDYIKLHKKMELSATGQYCIEYCLTIETAKSIAMLERNEKGKEVRNYFIKMEERAKQETTQPKQLSRKELALMIIEAEEEKERLLLENKQQDNIIEAITNTQDTYSLREAKSKLLVSELFLKNFLFKKGWIQYLSDGSYGKKIYTTSYSNNAGYAINKTVLNKNKGQYYHQFRITDKGLKYLLKKREDIESAL